MTAKAGENPVKTGSGRAAVREDETGMNQCMKTERDYMCEGAGSRLSPEPEELWETLLLRKDANDVLLQSRKNCGSLVLCGPWCGVRLGTTFE